MAKYPFPIYANTAFTNITYTNIARYKQRCVRDLAWLLGSASMFNSPLGGFDAFDIEQHDDQLFEWLDSVDHKLNKQPDAFPEISPLSFRRVGLYSEALLAFYFSQAQYRGLPYKILGRNVALRDKHSTLGECDLLIRDVTGEVIHVELAVKFYLRTLEIPPKANHEGMHIDSSNDHPWHYWVGPNSRDRLDLKLKRMIEHQLPLPHSEKAQEVFAPIKEALGIEDDITSKHIVKGRVYLPFCDTKYSTNGLLTDALPHNANSHTQKGTWMHRQQFVDFAQENRSLPTPFTAVVCDKMDWLAGPDLSALSENGCITLDEVIDKLDTLYALAVSTKRRLPPLMVLLRMSDSDNFYPLMLVPDAWPESTKTLS